MKKVREGTQVAWAVKRLYKRVFEDEATPEMSDYTNEDMLSKSEDTSVRGAIRQLVRDREADELITLHFGLSRGMRMSYSDISIYLNMPLGRVKYKTQKAIDTLKDKRDHLPRLFGLIDEEKESAVKDTEFRAIYKERKNRDKPAEKPIPDLDGRILAKLEEIEKNRKDKAFGNDRVLLNELHELSFWPGCKHTEELEALFNFYTITNDVMKEKLKAIKALLTETKTD